MQRRAFIAGIAGAAAAGVPASAKTARSRSRSGLIRSYVTGLATGISGAGDLPAAGNVVALVRAPHRRFDKQSIAVLDREGRLLGYLPGTHSRILAPLIEHGLAFEGHVLSSKTMPRPALHLEVLVVG